MAQDIQFRKAERKRAKARIALYGPAGSGKTHSSLRIAAGLVPNGKIAVIDTENGSAELEAGKQGIPSFDVVVMHAPFDPLKYIAAVHAAEEAGYDCIIIDSLSHAWAGSGGLLEKKDMLEKTKKNSFAAWRDITPQHNKLVDALLQSSSHIIATVRTKTGYAMDVDATGKSSVKKMGMEPVQRDGLEYEFTIVFDIDQASHLVTASKDRTSLFDSPEGKNIEIPSVETGTKIRKWLEAGAEETVEKNDDNNDNPLSDLPKKEEQKQEQKQGPAMTSVPITNGSEIDEPRKASSSSIGLLRQLLNQKIGINVADEEGCLQYLSIEGIALGSIADITAADCKRVIEGLMSQSSK